MDKLKAARKFYEGQAAAAEATINVYLTNSVGIGEHPQIIIAIIAPKIGIKCKNTPALFAPIIEIPLIQKKKAAIPGKITT